MRKETIKYEERQRTKPVRAPLSVIKFNYATASTLNAQRSTVQLLNLDLNISKFLSFYSANIAKTKASLSVAFIERKFQYHASSVGRLQDG